MKEGKKPLLFVKKSTVFVAAFNDRFLVQQFIFFYRKEMS